MLWGRNKAYWSIGGLTMENIARLIMLNWWILVAIGVTIGVTISLVTGRYAINQIAWAWIISIFGFLGVILLLLPVASLWYAQSWWYDIQSSIPQPQANVIVEPLEGTFVDSDVLKFVISIENVGTIPIDEVKIYFPFAEGLVFDYLNASVPLEPALHHPGKFSSTNGNFFLDANIISGEKLGITVPIQFTDYGNLEGALNIEILSLYNTGVIPIGNVGKNPIVVKTNQFEFPLSWVLLKR